MNILKKFLMFVFMCQIVDAGLLQFYNFSMDPELSQPSGSINYNNVLFIKKYTTTEFNIEKIGSNNFGTNFRFLMPNDFHYFIIEKQFELPYAY
jgi:hypothetical protein